MLQPHFPSRQINKGKRKFSKRLSSYVCSEGALSDADFALRIVMSTFFVAVGTLGVGGNALIIAIIRRTPSLHTNTNWFIANLALSDMLQTLVGGIQIFMLIFKQEWFYFSSAI